MTGRNVDGRREGWEKRLAEYLDSQRHKPFRWGVNDCILFAVRGANAVTKRNLLKHRADFGKYNAKTAPEILDAAGGSIADIFDRYLYRHKSPLMARRADLVMVEYNGVVNAGIVDTSGRRVACKTGDGFKTVDLRYVIAAWDIDHVKGGEGDSCRH